MLEDPAKRRRQQRRRAIIAWGTAALAAALVVLAAVFGGEAEDDRDALVYPPGYAMTAAQYEELVTGLGEAEFYERLEQTGSPEAQTVDTVIALFPPHEDGLLCSYWKIVDEPALARICFDEDGELAHAETSEALDDVLKALGEQISDQPVARAS